ncbi:MAG TPA: phage tail sheath C-terminal domain-containing protein [Candidatus Limnocylindrales bacterium]|nr:phage tail sheath C-terminal domain-containing protein [Candidatus Limnocylindrales bacterium]
MAEYLTPDVYVEEVPAGPRPIQAVGTRTAAFIGRAPLGGARPNEAYPVNNWLQFMREYVGGSGAGTVLSTAVYGFFQNGGSRCFIVNTADDDPVAGGPAGGGLRALEAEDEVAIVAAPGRTDAASYDAMLSHCENLRDRVAILDGPLRTDDIGALTRVTTRVRAAQERRRADTDKPGQRPRASDGGYGAFYFPGITTPDPITGELVDAPPSGHVAGIWARNDSVRGVHKAPANELVRGALNVTQRLTFEEQGVLNPAGVNCIRYFPREGIRVWGARTLADAASEWRYLNVRRLFNMVEESIAEATRWIVFEPNDRTLWKSIRRDIGAFLTRVWRDGALMGRTAEQAFFVKCDEETNPPDVIDAGMVIAVIGLAPVKPAEFVIFRISQTAGGVEIETEGQGA